MEATQMRWAVTKTDDGGLWYLTTYLRTSGARLDSWTPDRDRALHFKSSRAAIEEAKRCNKAAGHPFAGVIGWPVPAHRKD